MAGYTRQSAATIIAGANVTAAIFNAEFNQLQAAFNGTTGHGHSGGTGDGPKLVLTAAASVSGILPLANGGTGYGTRIEAYDNLHVVGSDIAVGSTVDLSAADGDYIEITGTGGTITSFGTGDLGVKRTLYFSGASNTITHNATSMICPNGVNMTVLAGEQLVVRSLGSGNWIVELQNKNSTAALGKLTLAADKLPYMSSTTAMSLTDLTSFGRSLIDDASASAARTTLGLGTISTQDSSNVTITGGSIYGITDLPVADGGTGASTAANARINLGVVIGTDVQGYDAGLAALAAFNTDGILCQTANDTFAGRTLTGTANEITVTNGTGVSGNPTLSLPSALTFTDKTVTGGTFTQPTITLKQGTGPTPTAEGDIQWDTDDDAIVVGNGSTQKIFRPSSWELIEARAISGATQYAAFTNLSAYRMIRITGYMNPASNNVHFYFSVSTDNGSTYDEGPITNYNYSRIYQNSTTVNGITLTTQTLFSLTDTTTVANSGYDYLTFELKTFEFNKAREAPIMTNSTWVTTTQFPQVLKNGNHAGTSARNALRFQFSSGNIAANSFIVVEGIRG